MSNLNILEGVWERWDWNVGGRGGGSAIIAIMKVHMEEERGRPLL